MTRPTIKILIETDLGYCCEWFFFSHFRQTALIADRLGVSTRAIKYHKEACRSTTCPGSPGCMKKLSQREVTPRQKGSSLIGNTKHAEK